jgi:ABC-type microcin C transport system permease subunit YejB
VLLREIAVKKTLGVLMIVGGLAAIALALLMIIPVGANLPASAFGVVLILIFAGGGAWIVYRGSKRLITRSETHVESENSAGGPQS